MFLTYAQKVFIFVEIGREDVRIVVVLRGGGLLTADMLALGDAALYAAQGLQRLPIIA